MQAAVCSAAPRGVSVAAALRDRPVTPVAVAADADADALGGCTYLKDLTFASNAYLAWVQRGPDGCANASARRRLPDAGAAAGFRAGVFVRHSRPAHPPRAQHRDDRRALRSRRSWYSGTDHQKPHGILRVIQRERRRARATFVIHTAVRVPGPGNRANRWPRAAEPAALFVCPRRREVGSAAALPARREVISTPVAGVWVVRLRPAGSL